ncbi:hypothetical protein [Paenibacillus tengchongensis]|uniref:hypothetical protein n=1 Tax=Paenibacillus tengchongensis TaxID=2608684 RepID=UPI00124D33EA|nr:hypothetical protein [Paenibacillus tengchongensis]
MTVMNGKTREFLEGWPNMRSGKWDEVSAAESAGALDLCSLRILNILVIDGMFAGFCATLNGAQGMELERQEDIEIMKGSRAGIAMTLLQLPDRFRSLKERIAPLLEIENGLGIYRMFEMRQEIEDLIAAEELQVGA